MTSVTEADPDGIAVERYDHVASSQVDRDIDAVFFASSTTRNFATDADRAAFRARWLRRYLDAEPEHAFVALAPVGVAVGYLVGSLTDPAGCDLYRDIGYFALLARETALYPAHLHVNIATDHRNRGVGERLVGAFIQHASDSGAPGVHVVTGAGARNVRFYERCGFSQVRAFEWQGHTLVMLGRSLVSP